MKKACSIVVALLASLFIYVFYRSDKTLINEIVKLVFSFDRYAGIKSAIAAMLPLNEIVIYSLPGGLWMFCATILAQDFYLPFRRYKIQMTYIPLGFAIGLELFQLLHVTNGRFDPWDVVFYVTFWLAATWVIRSQQPQQNILSPFTLRGFICLACFFSVFLAHVTH